MISLTRAPLGWGACTRPALHLPHPCTSTCTFVLSWLLTQMCMAGSNNTIHIRRVWLTQGRYVCITAIQHTYGGFWLHSETMCKYCCPHREYPFSVPHRSRRIRMTLNLFPTCHPVWIHPRDGHPLSISRMEAVHGWGGYRCGQREGHRAAYGRWERDC
jgi:hypothetical protein